MKKALFQRPRHPVGLSLFLLAGVSGCLQPITDSEVRQARGYVFFLDGAGAGGGFKNYARSVKKGLLAAGYDGGGENFHWQTWLGVAVDQVTTESYKRHRGADVAQKITERFRAHPDSPITLMGHSAGTAVAVFALEALPDDVQVENVVLLSGSLSSTYDLTKALQRVRGRMYITTSKKDVVLQFLVPLSGTADRARDTTDTIGVEGVYCPTAANEETLRQYAKVIEIPWSEQFAAYGDRGAHSDTVKASFVEAVVAPLVATNALSSTAARPRGSGEVENPDYRRWAAFAPGAWVEFEGYQDIDGEREPVRARVTLLQKSSSRAMIQRVFEPLGKYRNQSALTRISFADRWIDPAHHPLTHPASRVLREADESIGIQGQVYTCTGQSLHSQGEFRDWGHKPSIRALTCSELPGGMARVELQTQLAGKQVSYSGAVTRCSTGE